MTNQSNHKFPIHHPSIDAILFDMGGTLRRNHKRETAEKVAIVQRIVDLLEVNLTALEMTNLLQSREASYEAWATGTLVELNEYDIWTQWLLPDMPCEQIRPMAMQLNEIWREAIASRVLFPETKETITSLHRHGYRLALVSNTTSSIDSPRMLEKEGLSCYFEAIVLSCVLGTRKPGPQILVHAAEQLGVDPARCVYIGDRPEWDVVAARQAGFQYTIILDNPYRPWPETLPAEQTPDLFITNLLELLDIFPERN